METFFVFVGCMCGIYLTGFAFRLGWEMAVDLMYAIRVRFRRPAYDPNLDWCPDD